MATSEKETGHILFTCIGNRYDFTLFHSMQDCLQFCSHKMPFCAKQIIFAVFFTDFAILHNKFATLVLQRTIIISYIFNQKSVLYLTSFKGALSKKA